MKFMNKKRVASGILASALALSMVPAAFAASAPNTTNITGTYNAIKLAVTVPTTGKAIINPYGLPYKLGETTINNQQITTAAPLTIQNKSAVALAVKAKVTGTASTGVDLKESGDSTNLGDDADGVTTKTLRVKFEAFAAPTMNADTIADTAELNNAFAALDGTADLTADVTTAAGGNETEGTLVLREGDADGALQPGGAAFFRLTGEAAKKADWKAEDTFSASVAFTFTPSKYEKPAGTLTSDTQTLSMTGTKTTTVTLTPDLPDGVTPTKVIWTSSKPDVLKLDDASTLSGSVSIKANATGLKQYSTAVSVTVEVIGSDGISYTATTATGQKITVNA